MDQKIRDEFFNDYSSAEHDFMDVWMKANGIRWNLTKDARSFVTQLSEHENFEGLAYHITAFPKAQIDKWMNSSGIKDLIRDLHTAKKHGLDQRNTIDKNDLRAVLRRALSIANSNDDARTLVAVAKTLMDLEGLHVQKHEVTNTEPTKIEIVQSKEE